MEFYKNRRLAVEFVQKLHTKGQDKKVITYLVSKEFGFGEKFVNQQLDLLESITSKEE